MGSLVALVVGFFLKLIRELRAEREDRSSRILEASMLDKLRGVTSTLGA